MQLWSNILSALLAMWLSLAGRAFMMALPLALLLALLLAGDVVSETRGARLKPHAIEVEARPIVFDRSQPDATRFGRLTWRGGVELSSPASEFGGYSGIAVFPDGQSFIAVSDEGTWLHGDLIHDNDALAGIRNARTGPLLSKKGKTLNRKHEADAEDICLWQRKSGLFALISFERDHRIGRFPLDEGTPDTPVSYVDLPREAERLDDNKGLESVAVLTDGSDKGMVLTFAERWLDDDGQHTGWLVRGDRTQRLRMKREGDFEITGLAALPNGNVLVLERSFSIFAGVAMRLSEIDRDALTSGKRIEPREVFTASMRYDIDNMEGLSVHSNDRGETIVTLVSDNNFNKNGLQRTLLMQFRLD